MNVLPEPKKTPYYHLVPKSFDANLRFRRDMIKLGCESKDAARQLWIMCSRDILFYINTFCFTYDPRRNPSALPWITWEYQDASILAILDAIQTGNSLALEKSRDMGASWMIIAVMEWLWHFRELQSFLMLSRKEDLVDKTEDPDSLFWKIDFIHKNQPGWLRPNIERNKLLIHNRDNSSTIAGDSTTGDAARGGRRTAILLDEFASVDNGHEVLAATADATTCRIFNSTPKGIGNAFYDIIQSPIKRIRLHWSIHPSKAEGLYYRDGKPRSPWYDLQCSTRSEAEIAQELDINYLGAGHPFFSGSKIDAVERTLALPPYKIGELEYSLIDLRPSEFLEMERGRLKLWTHVDIKGQVNHDRHYVIGADISAGTGASNSAAVIGDAKTGEQIGEFVTSDMNPSEFAKIVIVLARYFSGPDGESAYVIWEANGSGMEFGKTILQLGFRNIYYRQNEQSISKKKTDIPGWFSNTEKKMLLLGEFRRALCAGDFTVRSKDLIKELREYVYSSNGGVSHSRASSVIDPSGANDQHGDRGIAGALCWKGIQDRPLLKATTEQVVPKNSFLARQMRHQESLKKEEYW